MSVNLLVTDTLLCRMVLMEMGAVSGLSFASYADLEALPIEKAGLLSAALVKDPQNRYVLRCLTHWYAEECVFISRLSTIIDGVYVEQAIDWAGDSTRDIRWVLREIAQPVAQRLLAKAAVQVAA